MADYPDYEGSKSSIITKSDWSIREGTDKTFLAQFAAYAWGESGNMGYNVPAATILYITLFTCTAWANLEEDADNNQMFNYFIKDATTGLYLFFGGGNGGDGESFAPAVECPAEHSIQFGVYGRAQHDIKTYICAKGYEV